METEADGGNPPGRAPEQQNQPMGFWKGNSEAPPEQQNKSEITHSLRDDLMLHLNAALSLKGPENKTLLSFSA